MTTRQYNTPYGPIYVSTPGAFDKYPNVNIYKQNKSGTRLVILQAPALRAFKAAEARFATRRHPHILITGVGYRSYSLQRDLWLGDTRRYADPDKSLHVEALAVDLDQGQRALRDAERAMRAEGWEPGAQFGDIPHWSYRLVG